MSRIASLGAEWLLAAGLTTAAAGANAAMAPGDSGAWLTPLAMGALQIGIWLVAMRAAGERETREPSQREGPRRDGASREAGDDGTSRQVAGMPCAACGERFVVADEAARCTACDGLVHQRGCLGRHVRSHGGPDGIYR